MKLHFIGMIIVLLLSIWIFSGCDLLPPEISFLPLVDDWGPDPGDGTLWIYYTFTNDGSVDLENCKVQFGIDEALVVGGVVYDNVTDWVPAAGVDLAQGETTTGVYDTGLVFAGVDYVGIYAVGFDNPPDD
jgi:hypothetical protein